MLLLLVFHKSNNTVQYLHIYINNLAVCLYGTWYNASPFSAVY